MTIIPYNFSQSTYNSSNSACSDTKKQPSYRIEALFLNTFKAIHLGGEETAESKIIQNAFAFCPTHSEKEMAKRLSEYNKVKGFLSRLSDVELSELLKSSTDPRSGTGGTVASITVEEVPVFVKKIRLTDVERKQPGSTQNIFQLPLFYQYGVGSMGFGVYREIKAHEMTTEWTLRGACQNFPLMYEYRILKQPAVEKTNASAEEILEREQYVEYWDGSSSVRARAEAAQNATYDIVVFLESIPTTLHKRIGKEDLSQANIDQIEKELLLVTHFMKIKGFLHFDAHFHNILTKDNHVYFADFGLALSRNFDLSPEENIFLQKHLDYDRSYVVGYLAESIAKREIKSILPKEEVETELDRFFSLKEMKINLPPTALRYRLVAHLMDNFFRKLREVSKSTPYPANELAKAWTEL